MRNEHGTSPGSPPYLQLVQRNARRKDAWDRRSPLRQGVKGLAAILRGESDV